MNAEIELNNQPVAVSEAHTDVPNNSNNSVNAPEYRRCFSWLNSPAWLRRARSSIRLSVGILLAGEFTFFDASWKPSPLKSIQWIYIDHVLDILWWFDFGNGAYEQAIEWFSLSGQHQRVKAMLAAQFC